MNHGDCVSGGKFVDCDCVPFMLQAHLETTTLDFIFLVILMVTFALFEKAANHPSRILSLINVITVVLNTGQLKAMQLEKMI